jgi:hypothetical protein
VTEELALVETLLCATRYHLQVLEEGLILTQRVDKEAHTAAQRHRIALIRLHAELQNGSHA